MADRMSKVFAAPAPEPEDRSIKVSPPDGGYLVEHSPAREAEGGRPAQGPLMRSYLGLTEPVYNGCHTLSEVFLSSAKKFASLPCLGKRFTQDDGTASPFKWMSYADVAEMVKDLAAGLSTHSVLPQAAIGVFGANSPEWMISMQACNYLNAKCVPLYDTLGENAVEFIVNHAQCQVVFVSAAKLANLLKSKGKLASVKLIVYWGDLSDADASALSNAGVKSTSFDALVSEGAKKNAKSPVMPEKAQGSDCCTIMYTSGTTGDPKGVVMTHGCLISCLAGVEAQMLKMGVEIGAQDVYLSYLPLAHIFDRVLEEVMIASGGAIGYWQGDVKKVLDDIGALRPTLFAGVPRIFERVYNAVVTRVGAKLISKLLFYFALGSKVGRMERGMSYRDATPFLDRIVFKKIKKSLGGRVRIIISGGAPLSPHVESFLRATMCCPVVQGYGLTETSAASFTAPPDDWRFMGTVGVPLPSVEFRLEAVPDMNYSPKEDPPRGEVLIRGPAVFKGYYKDEKKTAEAIDTDGFFHTGDVGEITPCGGLKIIDRKKNIFKLAQGEYVAVEAVESTYKKNLLFEQCWVYGNSFKPSLVAVVVPAGPKMMAWAKENGIEGDFDAVCADPKTAAHCLAELQKTGKESKLKGFEIVRAVHVDSEPFSVENDLTTPTFKFKRPQLKKHYDKEIEAMYASL